MLDAKILLPFALAALGLYVVDNARQIRALKDDNTPGKRGRFYRRKILFMSLAILIVPAACLWASNRFHSAMSPGDGFARLRGWISATTGSSAHDFESLGSVSTLSKVLLAVLVYEALPLLVRLKSRITLGDVNILLPRTPAEFAYATVLSVIAGLGEELLFRGFIPIAVSSFHVDPAIAFLASILIFAVCHLYQGVVGVAATGAAGAFLTMVYVLTGSLLLVIEIHVAVDFIGLVLRPLVGMGLRRLFQNSPG